MRFMRNAKGLFLCRMQGEKCIWRKRNGECSKPMVTIGKDEVCISISRPPLPKLRKGFLLIIKIVGNDCYVPRNRTPDDEGYFNDLHREIYKAAFGIDITGSVIRHACNNPSCLNPDHLRDGTHADNVMDRVLADRSARGKRNGRAKLNARKVRLIRNSTTSPGKELARQFGVDEHLIRKIRKRELWKHVI